MAKSMKARPDAGTDNGSGAAPVGEKSSSTFPADDRYEAIKRGDIHIAELQKCTMKELLDLARKEKLSEYTGLKKQDLIFKILKERTKINGLMFGEGTLEIL
ncbi:MAG: transcription termination factor Rho, partial [Planctomycetaceae bacterium]|nr:transcription termination factor Rho [Planctomycetaceae bacterium]